METFQHKIYLKKQFDHPVSKVFHAFQDVNILKQWWGPKHCTIGEAKMEFLIGGEYRIELIKQANKVSFFVVGQFHEIVKNTLIKYSYHYEGLVNPPFQKSLVSITFNATNSGTTIVHLIQEFVEEPRNISTRIEAWKFMFQRLSGLL